MLTRVLSRLVGPSFLLSLYLAATMSAPLLAIGTFRSFDNRLPNPDRPYDMTSGTVHFPSPPDFALYDLKFQPKNPSQLDIPTRNEDGKWEFDSQFDIEYTAAISMGLGPVHSVTGFGTTRAVGIAPGDPFTQVFDTELVSLNLFGLSPIPEVMFRESPTLRSSGVTTRENTCPPCASVVTFWRISSFFDVFAEFSFNGGVTWTPGDKTIHIEQLSNTVADADFNGDGVVDSADYIVWRRGNGTTYTASDYNLWRAHFGATTGTGSATNTSGAIPEPSTCWLVGVVAGCAAGWLRPMRRK
jgi:hypothetical protein